MRLSCCVPDIWATYAQGFDETKILRVFYKKRSPFCFSLHNICEVQQIAC